MTLRILSATNGYVPESTGQVVGFIRKEDKFKINQYCQMIPTKTRVGLYAELGADQSVRHVSDSEDAWEDGDAAPVDSTNKVPFQWREFRTFRRASSWVLGYEAIDQTTAFKPKPVHMMTAISQRMTKRTKRIIDLMEDTSNWSSNYGTATSLNGGKGKWDTASDNPESPFYNAISAALLEACRRINLATNSVVGIEDLRLVLSPGAAIKMSQSPEMKNYLRESPFAKQVMDGRPNMNALWGLPETYQGIRLVVEDASYVSERPKASGTQATSNRLYIKSDTSAVLVARPGGLDGNYGAPSFSTVQCYHFGGLLRVQTFDDPENERVKGRVSENFKEVLAAPISGFLITSIL